MFSGIVEKMGKIKSIKKFGAGFLFVIERGQIAKKIKNGSSVCVSGACLTVRKRIGSNLEFEIMPETLRKTILGSLKIGSKINLETSLKVGQELGGHFVYGHVDDVGEVVEVKKEGKNWLMSIKINTKWQKYLVPEGSVAVDGVSLTVARVKNTVFTVSLIEYTLKKTMLGKLKIGDKVNVEFDMLAKYLEKLKN